LRFGIGIELVEGQTGSGRVAWVGAANALRVGRHAADLLRHDLGSSRISIVLSALLLIFSPSRPGSLAVSVKQRVRLGQHRLDPWP
jgi:hypothetical protein